MTATTGYAVSAITDLQAISSSTLTDGYIKSVIATNSWYIYRASSTLTSDGDLVITPSSGSGRWIKMYQTGSTDTLTLTTTSIAATTSYQSVFNCCRSFIVTNLNTNYPARIRIYLNSTYAAADYSRPVTTELSGTHGCLLECVTNPALLSMDLSPIVLMQSNTSTPTLYLTLQNNDTTTRTITLIMSIKYI